MLKLSILPALLFSGFLVTTGCGDEEAPTEVLNTDPIVGAMELPISLRNDMADVGGAAEIEVAPRELRLDHRKLLDLSSGSLPEGAVADGQVTSLGEALRAAGNRPVSLKMHFLIPFDTFAALVATVQQTGVEEISIEVRRSQGIETGFLTARFHSGEEGFEFPESYRLPWDAVRGAWPGMKAACEVSQAMDCDGTPANIAEGGFAEMSLWARGRGLRLHFEQTDAPEPEPTGGAGPALIEGIPAPVVAEEPPPPPAASDATFSWRFQGAVQAPSPIGATVEQVCADRRCGVRLTADSGTAAGRLVSLLGAAFPNGRPAPYVHVVTPTER